MLTCNERRAVSRFPVLAVVACLLLPAMGPSQAYGAKEKGGRCSDGIDNDGDGLIDGADPDCGAGNLEDPMCLTFPELGSGAGLETDGVDGDGDLETDPYCDAVMRASGFVKLDTSRPFFVDFGQWVDLIANPFGGSQTTRDLPDGMFDRATFWTFGDSGVDLRAMAVGETRYDEELWITIHLTYGDGTRGHLSIWYSPGWEHGSCADDPPGTGNTNVTVTRIDETTWEIQNTTGEFDGYGDPVLSKAGLVEALTNLSGGMIESWCRTGPTGDLGASLTLPLFTVTMTMEPLPEDCADGVDNDGDGLIDCEDDDCSADPGCGGGGCTDGQKGDSCSDDTECCSGNCGGKPGNQTCK